MKQYIAVHRSDYNLGEIKDLIEATGIIRHYSPETYWEPGEDDVEYEIELDDEFDYVVKIMELHFFGEQTEILELPWAVVVNGLTYCFNEAENWEELLNSLGWVIFDNTLGDYEDSSAAVQRKIDEWVDEIAEQKAWDYIYEG